MARAKIPAKKPTPRIPSLAWVAILVAAVAFVIFVDVTRAKRVEFVSSAAGQRDESGVIERPRLIVPNHDNASYGWLDETRQLLTQGNWRVRHIDYQNAPYGRTVDDASPYRWWLGLIARIDRTISGLSQVNSLERAALVADPLLQLLFVIGATILVARKFGSWPAAALAAMSVMLFPFAAGFLPGAPNDLGLVRIFSFASVLFMVIGTRAAWSRSWDATRERRAQRWFLLGGIAGGGGLWLGVTVQAPVLIGIGLGGLAIIIASRRKLPDQPPQLPWLLWTLGGAGTTFAGYLIEYFPGHLGGWELRSVHLLYALTWGGGGWLLDRLARWSRAEFSWRSPPEIGAGLFGLAAFLSLPLALWRTHSWGFLEAGLAAFRLTRLTGDTAATSLWSWLMREGASARAGAVLLPVLMIVPAVWLLIRRQTGWAARASLALALGSVLVAIGFGCRQLSWWHQVDVLLLVLGVAVMAAWDEQPKAGAIRWGWSVVFAPILFLGAWQVVPPKFTQVLDDTDIFGLVERDLARWLAAHAGPEKAVILAPHNQTVTLHYFGGIRGLATLDRENIDGLGAAVRIVSASTPEEAKELIERRGVTHIVLPSWDSYLEAYTRMGIGKIQGTFYDRITNWHLPPWLKPVAYQLPTIGGFEKQSVKILEVVDDQDDAVALARTAEYFIEMQDLDQAVAVAQALRRFPADLGALTARAQVDLARDDRVSFDRTVESLKRRLAAGADRALLWDRRVSLAVVLARAKQTELARTQVERCFVDMNQTRLRSLDTGAIYRLQVLGKAFGVAAADPHLRELALSLLPADMQSRL